LIIDLREIGLGGVGSIDVAQDTEKWMGFVNTEMNLWIP
jgi:hypothetical protein